MTDVPDRPVIDITGLFHWSNVKDWMLSVSGHGLGYEPQTIASRAEGSDVLPTGGAEHAK